MSDDIFISEIRMFAFEFAPKGWAFCNGQLLPINQNQALFSLLGTMYGGDGRVNFALPNLQGRVPVHAENGFNGLGERGGEIAHTLTVSELPAHTHFLSARNNAPGVVNGNVGSPTKVFAQGLAVVNTGNQPVNMYGSGAPTAAMGPSSTSNTGGSQAHNNMMPYLAINFCIALQGIFPSQN
jgi:microcystin-dependent protein